MLFSRNALWQLMAPFSMGVMVLSTLARGGWCLLINSRVSVCSRRRAVLALIPYLLNQTR